MHRVWAPRFLNQTAMLKRTSAMQSMPTTPRIPTTVLNPYQWPNLTAVKLSPCRMAVFTDAPMGTYATSQYPLASARIALRLSNLIIYSHFMIFRVFL